jgi:hypothetical protein
MQSRESGEFEAGKGPGGARSLRNLEHYGMLEETEAMKEVGRPTT